MAQLHDDATANDELPELDMDNMDDAATALAAAMDEDETLTEEDEPEDGEPDEVETDDEDEGELDTPAIAPPASLTAEEKERFLALPQEQQELIAGIEARRNKDVQEGLSKAKAAQQQAEAIAAQTQTSAAKVALEQFHSLVQATMAPQEPDWRLAQADPMAYIQAKAQYDAQLAQQQGLVQQIAQEYEALTQQEEQLRMQTLQSEAVECVGEVPELRDTAQLQDLLARLTPIAKELGWPEDRIGMATPADIRAMKRVETWKAKAAKYDQLQGTKMTAVRSHKAAKPNVPQGRHQGKVKTFNQARERLKSSGDMNAAAAAIAALE